MPPQLEQLRTYGILAGTLPATGPGLTLDIRDPSGRVDAPVLLDTLQELRDAGAEAVQIGDVRVVAGTWFTDGPADDAGVRIDGTLVRPPYRFVAVGDPQTMSGALSIPGGVLAVLSDRDAEGIVTTQEEVVVDALRDVPDAEYARPSPGDDG